MIVSASARPDSVSSRGSSLHRKRRSAYTQQAHAAAQGAFRSHAGPAVRPRVAHRGHTQLRGCLKRSHKATRGRRGGIGARGGINYYGAKSPRSARIFMPKRTSSAMSSSTMGGLPSSPPVHWPSSGSASISSMLLRGRNAKEQLKERRGTPPPRTRRDGDGGSCPGPCGGHAHFPDVKRVVVGAVAICGDGAQRRPCRRVAARGWQWGRTQGA